MSSKKKDFGSIIELLKQDYSLKAEKVLKQKVGEIAQDHINRGLYNSTACISKQLQVYYDHIDSLIDYIVESLKKDLVDIPLDQCKEKLLIIVDEEYKKLGPFANAFLVNTGLASPNTLKDFKQSVDNKRRKSKQAIETKFIMLTEQKSKIDKIKRRKIYWRMIITLSTILGIVWLIIQICESKTFKTAFHLSEEKTQVPTEKNIQQNMSASPNGVQIAGDVNYVYIDNRQGLSEKVFTDIFVSQSNKISELSWELGQTVEKNKQLEKEYAEAIKTVEQLKKLPNYNEQAEKVLEDLRKTGDAAKLQALLIEVREADRKEIREHTEDLIKRNYEILAVAYSRGDINIAIQTIEEILKIKPNDYFAQIIWANVLANQAQNKEGADADQLFAEAYAKYQNIIEMEPNNYDVLNNWGNALSNQANKKAGREADRIFAEAYAKYQNAIEINPDRYDAWYNWGIVLTDQAQKKESPEANKLYAEAYTKYKKAVEVDPDKHEAWNNWGCAILAQARKKTDDEKKNGAEADKLLVEAYAKYQKAVEIKPNKHEAWNNWGCALSVQAKNEEGVKADKLYVEAYAKYNKAVEIEPNMVEAWYGWGNALSGQAQNKKDSEADKLFANAYAKYQKAVKIKPDKRDAWYNWGNALAKQAQKKTGSEADNLLVEACAKYQKATEIKPDYHEAWYNWGNVLSMQAEKKEDAEADKLLSDACTKYQRATEIKPDKYEAWGNWGIALLEQALKKKKGDEADKLFAEAYAKYQKVTEIKADSYESWNKWGNALLAQARKKTDDEKKNTLLEAKKKYLKAEQIGKGKGVYNLACIAAIEGDEVECRKWLKIGEEAGTLMTREYAMKDEDLKAYWDKDWFKAIKWKWEK
jgi:cytochrome c-type biogenesis protein CcmH/NrfG